MFAVFTVGFCLVACSNNANSDNPRTIKIGDNLPELPVTSLDLRDLTPTSNSDIDTDFKDDVASSEFNRTSVEYYKSEQGNKELHVAHYDNKNHRSLEDFTRIKFFDANLGYNNNRMGKSEVYALTNAKINDGYYVKLITKPSAYICQQVTYEDVENFIIMHYLYPCTGENIGGTNVNVSIPIKEEATLDTGVYGKSSKKYSYEKKTELPSITYYITQKSVNQALSNYNTPYNATTEQVDYSGIKCGIAREENTSIEDSTCNIVTVLIPTSDGRTVGIEFREKSDSKTYSFAALTEGIYLN